MAQVSAGSAPAVAGAPQQRVPHLVNLKVLRAARPTLARNGSTIPYVDFDQPEHGPAFKELYDGRASEPLEPLSNCLVLPSAFGSIYLGETFTAILCLSNDSDDNQLALAPMMKVELHTFSQPNSQQPTNKYQLATVTHPGDGLAQGNSVETVVSHEIKDLAGHALVCTVTYGVRNPATGQTTSRSFRKVYKFAVANPLSVRTKAHSPSFNCATASLSPLERNKVFLEVQLQPQCDTAMSFEKLTFLPVEGYQVTEANPAHSSDELLPQGCVRQHLYILQPSPPDRPVRLVPGSSQALGKLDIVWRTANGELGRLQTSMLGRKVPFPVVSSKPLSASTAPSTPPRSRLSSETPRTNSPRPYVRQAAPVTLAPPSPVPSHQAAASSSSGQTFDLVVESITPPTKQTIEEPFTLRFKLIIANANSASMQAPEGGQADWRISYVPQSARRLDKPSTALPDLTYLGPSSFAPSPLSSPVSTAAEETHEYEYEWDMTFVSFEVGLFDLGGIRLLLGSGGADRPEGRVAREWDSVGEVWIGD